MSLPDYLISTPENVDLHLELAGLGNRIFAALVDGAIIVWSMVLVTIACLLAANAASYLPLPKEAKTISGFYFAGACILANMFIFLGGYHIVFEGLWQGQTPGKRLAQIRVVEQNGQAVSWSAVIIRNLLRMIDIGVALVGLLFIVFDRHERRIGDLAAGTLVIRERMPAMAEIKINTSAAAADHLFVDAGRLSPQEYDLLWSFLERREKLAATERPLLASDLERYFRDKLAEPSQGEAPEQFLETIYQAYRARADRAVEA